MAAKPTETKRKTPRQARARATVDAILFAAAHILKTDGQSGFTTNRIAEVAGVSIGSLYQYFPNKQAIVDALRERHDKFYEHEVQEGIERSISLDFREGLQRMLRQMVVLHRQDTKLHGEIRRDLVLTGADEREFTQHLIEFLEEEREQLRPIPDRELTAFIAMTTLQHLIHGVVLHSPERLDNPHYIDELVELAARYFGADHL